MESRRAPWAIDKREIDDSRIDPTRNEQARRATATAATITNERTRRQEDEVLDTAIPDKETETSLYVAATKTKDAVLGHARKGRWRWGPLGDRV